MWVLTITTGVILQGLGRLALAKIYMKTEQVIEKVQAQARARQAGERTGDPGGSLNGNQTEDQGGDERKGKVKLNGVSASIGMACYTFTSLWNAVIEQVKVGRNESQQLYSLDEKSEQHVHPIEVVAGEKCAIP